MTIKVELKEGFPPLDELSTVYLGFDGTWQGLLQDNLAAASELDNNKKPFRVLTKEELEALADYVYANCADIKGRAIASYYFEVGTHRVGFGSRVWQGFLKRVADYEK